MARATAYQEKIYYSTNKTTQIEIHSKTESFKIVIS
jgi:hypothetical protein